jgi:hypothetical protein
MAYTYYRERPGWGTQQVCVLVRALAGDGLIDVRFRTVPIRTTTGAGLQT